MTESTVRPRQAPPEPQDMRMRARQLASSVRNGRRIMLTLLDEDVHIGYLAGWDTDTYFLVYPGEGDDKGKVIKDLIPKTHIIKITLFDERTFQEEPLYEEMNKVVRPFRDLINKTYFHIGE